MAAPLVALVDDDAQALILLRRAMQHQAPEASLVEVRSAKELDELLASRSPDVILLDFNLPDRDGLALLRDLRKRGFEGGVVFITGVGSEKIAVEAMKRGATDYIVKSPGYEVHVPRAIKKVLERVQLERELFQEALARRSGKSSPTSRSASDLAARLDEPLERSLEEIDALAKELDQAAEDPHAMAAAKPRIDLHVAKLKTDLERLHETLARCSATS